MSGTPLYFDVAIVGGGLAGFTTALRLPENLKIGLFCKKSVFDSASNFAQGGIAAVMNPVLDSTENHVKDTLEAGAGLCDESATRFIVENGAEAIAWLINQGASFSRDDADSGYHLTREGGHSERRIFHAADATGAHVQQTLEKRIRESKNITVFENHFAVDLITSEKLGDTDGTNACHGLYVLDDENHQVLTVIARHTVIASGGAGKVYLYTTNPDTSTGDGIAMAWRAGCRVSNMEFVQFHPTCLYHPYAKSFLISEAVRGEGGQLKLPTDAGEMAGERFMGNHHPKGELAPRDVVARSIDFEMKKRGLDYVHLDISHQSEEFLKSHFPNILAKCKEFGIDITKEPIPVVPATHFTCGGIVTDTYGRTDIPNLYAVGEAACTGLHGANRLASNSLLECLVVGAKAAEYMSTNTGSDRKDLPLWDESRVSNANEEVVISHNWDELRRFMWNYVGIVRTTKRLERAQRRIALLREEIDEYYANFIVSTNLLELRNLVDVAGLIVESALSRKESRGLHFNTDYPATFPKAVPTVLTPPKVRRSIL